MRLSILQQSVLIAAIISLILTNWLQLIHARDVKKETDKDEGNKEDAVNHNHQQEGQ